MTEAQSLLTCSLCPHHCQLAPGQTGFCRARSHREGKIRPDNYGFLTSLALDPIEKSPSAASIPEAKSCPWAAGAAISAAPSVRTPLFPKPGQKQPGSSLIRNSCWPWP